MVFNLNSKSVEEIIEKHDITKNMSIMEIGCGEGRDAIHLLKSEYNLLATDLSPTAVDFCKQSMPDKAQSFRVLNCLTDTTDERFDFIYAIAVLHMLVVDEDRELFYQFIGNQLNDTGIALICTIGDGVEEWSSDPSTAFELRRRLHESSGEELI